MRGVFILARLVACTHPITPQVAKIEAPPPEPMRIAFGDCTTDHTPFVSGPWSVEFTDAAAMPSESSSQGGSFASLTGTGDVSSGFDDSNIYAGTGSGGTGWGTIGTGRYGTIGHGTSTGGMRGRNSTAPSVSIGVPSVNGDLDKAIIRRYIKRNIQKLEYCYEKQLLAKPGLAGTVQTQFFITPDGMVSRSDASGVDPDVADCVADVIRNVEFPKPRDGGVSVNFPFTFHPGEGAAPEPPPPPSPPPSPFRPVAPERVIVPGAASPLRAQSDAIEACVRGRRAGTRTCSSRLDVRRQRARLRSSSPDDAELAACLHAIKIVISRSRAADEQRCGLAVGAVALDRVPGDHDHGADVLVRGATTVDRVADIVTDIDLGDRSAKLSQALDAWAQHEPIRHGRRDSRCRVDRADRRDAHESGLSRPAQRVARGRRLRVGKPCRDGVVAAARGRGSRGARPLGHGPIVEWPSEDARGGVAAP